MAQPALHVTCTAPVNIAVIKYWGKRDEDLILPVNASISGTLHQRDLKSKTTIALYPNAEKDRMWLNGKEENINEKRLQNCLREIRKRIVDKVDANGKVIYTKEQLSSMKVHIVSFNNFPTASGLASSASGFACLVFTLTQLFGLKENYPGEFSSIARVGSGSACRSLYGGFVKWNPGEQKSGEDSIAVQVAPESHWPLKVFILVVSQKRKDVSSTSGMQTTVETSELLQYRKDHVVPKRTKVMEKAILEKDFHTFAVETMKDSNQFHAVCLDTYPPIFYLNDVSKKIIHLVTKYNEKNPQIRTAYTFDAGPNAVLYTPVEYAEEVKSLISHYFPLDNQPESKPLRDDLKDIMDIYPNVLQQVIDTEVGPGPQVLSPEESLINLETGLPK